MRTLAIVIVMAVAAPAAAKQSKSEAEITAVIAAQLEQIREPSQDATKICAPDAKLAVTLSGETEDTTPLVACASLTNGLVGVGFTIDARPKADILKIELARDGVTAWVTMNVRLVLGELGGSRDDKVDYRASEIVAYYPVGWRIVGGMWSVGQPNDKVNKAAAAGKLKLAALPDASGDASLDAAFTQMLALGLQSKRADFVAIGSAAGEKSVGGATFAKAWNAAWAEHVDHDGPYVVALAQSRTVGWVIANLKLTKTKGKTSYDVPFRVCFVFARATSGEGSEWELVHAHFATTL